MQNMIVKDSSLKALMLLHVPHVLSITTWLYILLIKYTRIKNNSSRPIFFYRVLDSMLENLEGTSKELQFLVSSQV